MTIQPTGNTGKITIKEPTPDIGSFEHEVNFLAEMLYHSGTILRANRQSPFLKKIHSLGNNKQIKLELRSGKIFAKDASNPKRQQDIELITVDQITDIWNRHNSDDSDDIADKDIDPGEQEVVNILIEKLGPYKTRKEKS